jgi:hypothetical protein
MNRLFFSPLTRSQEDREAVHEAQGRGLRAPLLQGAPRGEETAPSLSLSQSRNHIITVFFCFFQREYTCLWGDGLEATNTVKNIHHHQKQQQQQQQPFPAGTAFPTAAPLAKVPKTLFSSSFCVSVCSPS